VPGVAGWQPIPEDRDFAFSRYEGTVLAVARNWYPRWVVFGKRYPPMLGLTWQGWPLDRELLTELDKPAWDDIAADLQARLTDGVIDDAVRTCRRSTSARTASGSRRSCAGAAIGCAARPTRSTSTCPRRSRSARRTDPTWRSSSPSRAASR
jgi:hypothetical protein